jgi:hypothetical protein
MEPMFLKGVENNPKPGPYLDSLQLMREAGKEYPQIWHLFAFLPEATEHLARFTQEVMRGPAPISPGMRELIAAFTSYRNDCPF